MGRERVTPVADGLRCSAPCSTLPRMQSVYTYIREAYATRRVRVVQRDDAAARPEAHGRRRRPPLQYVTAPVKGSHASDVTGAGRTNDEKSVAVATSSQLLLLLLLHA